jgi:hypothetical protein
MSETILRAVFCGGKRERGINATVHAKICTAGGGGAFVLMEYHKNV